jgi:hypothetical protein
MTIRCVSVLSLPTFGVVEKMLSFSIQYSRRMVMVVAALTPLWSGCNGNDANLGRVSGTVTLDGQPLANALLIFSPTHAGAPSAGKTDSSGHYSLIYTADKTGAEIGEHHVWISTRQDADEDSDPPRTAVPEQVPAKYRTGKELKVEIQRGHNEIDFPLDPDPSPSARRENRRS